MASLGTPACDARLAPIALAL
ncbi:hypothetical protein AYI70_g6755, partial [Smittium culicis]